MATYNSEFHISVKAAKHKRMVHRIVLDRLFSPKILILLIGGLLLNSLVAIIVNLLGLPLYIDNIGTILAASLGGPLIGIVVGFLSNCITSANTPISLYYGIITVANAFIVAYFSSRGYLRSWKGALLLLPFLVFFGGFCGSLLTWVLYGGGIGGKGAALAMYFSSRGWASQSSQLMADVLIDVVDKAITIFAAILFLRHYPKRWADWFPLSYLYGCSDDEIGQIDKANKAHVRKRALADHMQNIVMLALLILSVILTTVSCYFYLGTTSNLYDTLEFIIKLTTVEFGIALVIIALLIWYIEHHFTIPMNVLVNQVTEFKNIDPEKWLDSDCWKNRRDIVSGDELETLYLAICTQEEMLSRTVISLRNSHRRLKEAVRLESENRVLSLQLEQVKTENKVKTDFYNRMSHDIRTPMNGIIGYTQLALSEDNPDTVRTELEKIEGCSHYLLNLINDALDMSKIEAEKFVLSPEPSSLKKVILEQLDSVSISARMKHLNLEVAYEEFNPDIYVLIDKLRFQQICINLLSNAVKYTPEGGHISLIFQDRGSDEKTCRVRIIVRDTGVGMSDDYVKNHLFQQFTQEVNSQTEKSVGSGLGLYIVKHLVDLMNGTISCESELGKGTAFTVDLDFMITTAKKAENLIKPNNIYDLSLVKASLTGRHVLLCEDNEINQEIVKKALKKMDVSVTSASNGEQCVDLFKASDLGAFDAILMDVQMPVMDGITATRHIRALQRADAVSIPIIALTANAYKKDQEKMRDAGMNAHLVKPFNIQELYIILANLID